jgi:lipopolysaccharide biosynthesis regulator YciM
LAEYFVGLTYMEEDQSASAETALKKTAGSWDGNLAALSKQALAHLYQQTGRDSMAIDLYNELIKQNAATVPAGLAKIELAELYQSEGKADDAKKIYAELKDKDKDSEGKPGPAAELATEKLNPRPASMPQLQ